MEACTMTILYLVRVLEMGLRPPIQPCNKLKSRSAASSPIQLLSESRRKASYTLFAAGLAATSMVANNFFTLRQIEIVNHRARCFALKSPANLIAIFPCLFSRRYANLIYVSSNIPMACSAVYKERAFRNQKIHVLHLTQAVSIWQVRTYIPWNPRLYLELDHGPAMIVHAPL